MGRHHVGGQSERIGQRLSVGDSLTFSVRFGLALCNSFPVGQPLAERIRVRESVGQRQPVSLAVFEPERVGIGQPVIVSLAFGLGLSESQFNFVAVGLSFGQPERVSLAVVLTVFQPVAVSLLVAQRQRIREPVPVGGAVSLQGTID